MPSDRLLQTMRKVIQHDLPNQMVALQALLQFLASEEAERLSNDGREYVRRLQNAASHASQMLRLLKQLEQVKSFEPKSEPIAIPVLAQELQGELLRHYQDRHFEFNWNWAEATMIGDPRAVLNALLQLYACFASPADANCRMKAWSNRSGDELQLSFEWKASSSPGQNLDALEKRPEIILAREWLALSNATVTISPPAEGLVAFQILGMTR